MSRQIAILALIAALGAITVLYPVIAPTAASHLQPPTATPNAYQRAAIAEQTATAEARRHATPTPRPVTSAPGEERRIGQNPGALNCRLAHNEQWQPLEFLAHKGAIYVRIRTETGCEGWILDPG